MKITNIFRTFIKKYICSFFFYLVRSPYISYITDYVNLLHLKRAYFLDDYYIIDDYYYCSHGNLKQYHVPIFFIFVILLYYSLRTKIKLYKIMKLNIVKMLIQQQFGKIINNT